MNASDQANCLPIETDKNRAVQAMGPIDCSLFILHSWIHQLKCYKPGDSYLIKASAMSQQNYLPSRKWVVVWQAAVKGKRKVQASAGATIYLARSSLIESFQSADLISIPPITG